MKNVKINKKVSCYTFRHYAERLIMPNEINKYPLSKPIWVSKDKDIKKTKQISGN